MYHIVVFRISFLAFFQTNYIQPFLRKLGGNNSAAPTHTYDNDICFGRLFSLTLTSVCITYGLANFMVLFPGPLCQYYLFNSLRYRDNFSFSTHPYRRFHRIVDHYKALQASRCEVTQKIRSLKWLPVSLHLPGNLLKPYPAHPPTVS